MSDRVNIEPSAANGARFHAQRLSDALSALYWTHDLDARYSPARCLLDEAERQFAQLGAEMARLRVAAAEAPAEAA